MLWYDKADIVPARSSMFRGRGRLLSSCVVTSIVLFVLLALIRLDSFGLRSSLLPLPTVHESTDADSNELKILPIGEDDVAEDVPPTTPTEDTVKVQTITYSLLPHATMANPPGLPVPEVGLPASFAPPKDAFKIKDRVASITETRPLSGLVPLILHYANVLGPEWPILFITSQETIDFYTKKHALPAAFKRLLETGQVRMQPIPETVQFGWAFDVSMYLASKWFWDQMGTADHLLLFQADAVLCSNSPRKVDDYFNYDFVGAPVIPMYGGGMNGGLSYRNVSLSRQVVAKWDIRKDFENDVPHANTEDQWFWMRMGELGGRMPTEEVARTFAVETMWEDMPFGYHAVSKWYGNRLPEVERWCPEWKLTTNQGILEKQSLEDEDSGTKSRRDTYS